MPKLNPEAIPFTPVNTAAAAANDTADAFLPLPHHPQPLLVHQACFFYPSPYISRTPNPCAAYNFECYIPTGAPYLPLAPAGELFNAFCPEIKTMEEKDAPMLSASSGGAARGPRVRGGRHRLCRSSQDGSCSRVFWMPKASASSAAQNMPLSAASTPPEDFELCSSAEDELFCGAGGQGKTTVMIKNIPNKFSKQQLLDLLDEHCRKENAKISEDSSAADSPLSEFDFLYLPMDFLSGSNLGYAFVNFTSIAAARRLRSDLHHKPWNAFGSRKVCEVTHAKIQGSEGLLKHFKSSIFTCSSSDYLPVFFNPSRDGLRQTKGRLVGKLVHQSAV